MTPDLPALSVELLARLEADIQRRGVIIPIVVDRNRQILDGKIRKEIADRHGLFCPQVFVDGDTSDLRVTLNMYRRQLSQKQVRELIAWELAKTPHHSDRRIAARVGCDKNTVGKVRATGESHQSPREGVDGKTCRRPTIVHAPTPMLARQTQALLDDVEQLPEGVVTQRKLRSVAFQEKILAEASQPVAQLPANTRVFHADCLEFDWSAYEGKATLVLADPPWLNDHAELRAPFAALCFRLLKPGGVLACYTGTYHLPGWIEAFQDASKLRYNWCLASVNRGNAKVRIQGRGRVTIQSAWRPILIYSKGDIVGDRVLYDVIESPAQEKTHHAWQQPVNESLMLIRTFSKPGDLIVDPTCGSGTSGAAVVQAGQGREYVGVDRDENAVKVAMNRLAATARQAEQEVHQS